MLLVLICGRTQTPQGNSTSPEGAAMGSHKTCPFPNTSPKRPRSSSPCGTVPHVPPVHKEKGTAVFCGRARGCCWQRRTTAFTRSGVVESGRALQAPSHWHCRARADVSASRRGVPRGLCIPQHGCVAKR